LEEQTVFKEEKEMMNHMMPYGMMAGVPLFWMVIGLLLCLLLVAAVTWLLTRWRNEQRLHQMHSVSQPQDASYTYEQGYQSPGPSSETYQEGGHDYSYPQPVYEQPMAQYPQEKPLRNY
jgi:hypothetical protein